VDDADLFAGYGKHGSQQRFQLESAVVAKCLPTIRLGAKRATGQNTEKNRPISAAPISSYKPLRIREIGQFFAVYLVQSLDALHLK
jgi:hypothetical protein